MTKESKIILAIIGVVIVAAIGLVSYINSTGVTNSPTAMAEKLVRDNSHTLGKGKVQVVEFGDYQCPACGEAYPITKKLISDFDGKITFVFRNFPLPMHANAQAAAEAAEAAAAQGKFWEMHDKLFSTQNQWSALYQPNDTFVSFAKELGLNTDTFTNDITNKAHKDYIEQDKSDGYALGITGTPTFYVNGKQQAKFDYDSLKKAIEAEL